MYQGYHHVVYQVLSYHISSVPSCRIASVQSYIMCTIISSSVPSYLVSKSYHISSVQWCILIVSSYHTSCELSYRISSVPSCRMLSTIISYIKCTILSYVYHHIIYQVNYHVVWQIYHQHISSKLLCLTSSVPSYHTSSKLSWHIIPHISSVPS